MKVLFIDGMNLLHRARSGFQLGDYNVVYNLFKGLKPLVEKFAPNRVYFTLEGHPKKRYELLPTYKANRHIDTSTPAGAAKGKSLEDFFRQVDLIVGLMQECFPISILRHPDHEADDLIYNVIDNASRAVEFTVVSTDTDFIQLLQGFSNVKLYNPVTKAFVEAPEHDYVHWKALRGDGSDNVPKVAGFNDARAAEALLSPGGAVSFLNDPALVEQWRRNCGLIRFIKWDDEEAKLMQSSSPVGPNWDRVEECFAEWAFRSMLKPDYWTKFKAAFDPLWG